MSDPNRRHYTNYHSDVPVNTNRLRTRSSGGRRDDPLMPRAYPENPSFNYNFPSSPNQQRQYYTTTVNQDHARRDSGLGQSLPPLPYPAHASLPDTRVLDPRYTLQPGHYFRKGKVFSILWHENEGQRACTGTQASAGPQYRGRFGESIYSTIRRMVVIKELGNCCWCFAISTYGGQGVAKAGVDASKHTIVYMQRSWAMPGSNEPRMTKEPLEVAPERHDERLDAMSRLNFGKIYTVEHNVKVLPIGTIAPASMARFTNYARAELEV